MYLQSESLEFEADPFRILDSLCLHLKQKNVPFGLSCLQCGQIMTKSSLIVIHINNSRRSFNILNVKPLT